MKKSTVAPATEIVVSLMSHYADTAGNNQLQNDPRTYIYKTTHINIPENVDLSVVQNTGGVVNLVLPYYDGVPTPANAINEAELEGVAGGIGYAEMLAVQQNHLWQMGVEETGREEVQPSTFGRAAMQSQFPPSVGLIGF